MMSRKRISSILKALTAFAAVCGVLLSFLNAESDGYSHWSKRLLYFTAQSNIWIALMSLALVCLPYINRAAASPRVKNSLYIVRYVFTVSITLTGFIFCAVLAPGAENDNYNAWTLSSVITHIVVPVLAITDFFFDPYRVKLYKKHIPLAVLPPLAYMIFSVVLGAVNIDFGRGDNFPYFFLNFKSPAGIFGTSDVMPYRIGSFYWIVFMLLIILGIGALYLAVYNKTTQSQTEYK